MIVSPYFYNHLEQVEGYRAKAYHDTAGHMTIGIGHLIKDDEPELKTMCLSHEAAIELAKGDVALAEAAVNTYVKVPLRQEQFDALVSFVYNIGVGAFAKSTLLRKLNHGHCCAVPDEMRKWTKQRELRSRRSAEIALYVGECTDATTG